MTYDSMGIRCKGDDLECSHPSFQLLAISKTNHHLLGYHRLLADLCMARLLRGSIVAMSSLVAGGVETEEEEL